MRQHEAWGLGSYIYTNVNPSLHADERLRGAGARRACGCTTCCTVSLNKAGTIDHVINGVGAPATADASGVPSTVTDYPAP